MTAPTFPFRTVVFDLDGTLVDSRSDVAAAVNHVLAEAGLQPLPSEQWSLLLGEGARIRMKTAFALRGVDLPGVELDRAVAAFKAHYAGTMLDRTRPYPGALDTVARLHAQGVTIAVCTNKDEAAARQMLQQLGFMPFLAGVAGPDTFGVQKPDPRHILDLLHLVGGDPLSAVMIGDSIHDIEAAHRAGMPAAHVTWGYGDRAHTRPQYTVTAFPDLVGVLSKPPVRDGEAA